MKLKLQKPLCFFDLETTGLNLLTDRIVEISILKILPDETRDAKRWLVNPEMPIPQEVTNIHGITNQDVKDVPPFKEIANDVYNFIKDSDLAGYNSNKFDIPLLAEELLRAGVDFDFKNMKAIDVQNIFHKKEKRTLEAAYKFYCHKDLELAHSAEADTMASFEVLEGQLARYEDLEPSVSFLADYSSNQKTADLAGYIAFNNKNEEIFTFGKYKGQKVEAVFEANQGYFSWIQSADFPVYTKRIFTNIRLRKLNTH